MTDTLSAGELLSRTFPGPGDDWAEQFRSGLLIERIRASGLISPDIEVSFRDSHGLGIGELNEVFVGIEGYERAWSIWLASWESWRTEAFRIHEGNEAWLVEADITARPKSAEVEMSLEVAVVYRVRDGLVVEITHHADLETARRAFETASGA